MPGALALIRPIAKEVVAKNDKVYMVMPHVLAPIIFSPSSVNNLTLFGNLKSQATFGFQRGTYSQARLAGFITLHFRHKSAVPDW